MEYSQGNWVVKETLRSTRDPIFYYTSVICGGKRVARAVGTSTDEAEANARLIAAAPDLLAICKSIVEIIDYLGEVNNTDKAVIKELKQAIAKATD